MTGPQSDSLNYDLFFSYSTKDQEPALDLVNHVESHGVRCWIAPRDIATSTSWAGAIIEGLDECHVFLLFLTENSNKSNQVLREVERAVDKGMTIIPVIFDDVAMSPDLQYFLSTIQWLDARGNSFDVLAQQIVDITVETAGAAESKDSATSPSADLNRFQKNVLGSEILNPIVQHPPWKSWQIRSGLGIASVLLGICLVSVVFCYKVFATDLWLARFVELKGTWFRGFGFEIDCARPLIYIPCVTFLLLSFFRKELGQLLDLRCRNGRVWLIRLLLCSLSLSFGAFETYRHLTPNEAPRKLAVSSGVEHPSAELIEKQRAPYQAFLPYSLVNYMFVVPLLTVIPLTAAFTDFPRVQAQGKWLVSRMSDQKLDSAQIISTFRKFESNCQSVCEKYLSFLMVMLVGINFECWVGRHMATDSGFALMIKAYSLCTLVGFGCFIWMFSVYIRTNKIATRALINTNSTQSVRFRNEHNGASFLRWLLSGTPMGMLTVALVVMLIFWSFKA